MIITRPIFVVIVAVTLNLIFIKTLTVFFGSVNFITILLIAIANYLLANELWNSLITWIIKKANNRDE